MLWLEHWRLNTLYFIKIRPSIYSNLQRAVFLSVTRICNWWPSIMWQMYKSLRRRLYSHAIVQWRYIKLYFLLLRTRKHTKSSPVTWLLPLSVSKHIPTQTLKKERHWHQEIKFYRYKYLFKPNKLHNIRKTLKSHL